MPVIRLLAVLLLLLALPTHAGWGAGTVGTGATGPPPPAGISQVQKKTYASSVANTSHSVTLDSAPTSGNLLILAVVADATASTPGGWSLAISGVSNTGTYIFYKTSVGAETTTSVTIGASTNAGLVMFEYSGMAASSQLDKTASVTSDGSSGTVSTGTTATTAQADELLVAVVGVAQVPNTSTVSSWSNSFAAEAFARTSAGIASTQPAIAVAGRIVSATGAYTTTATLSANTSNSTGLIATFKGN